MLISQRHNFIFIHIPKNAGTSITRALMPFALSNFRLKMIFIQNKMTFSLKGRFPGRLPNSWVNPGHPYDNHIGAPYIFRKIGRDVFKSYFSFAIVRNPWEQQVSLYTFGLKAKWHPSHEFYKGLRSFDDYIKWRCSEEASEEVRYQKDFIYSEDGELLVSFVGHYERLERDFNFICSQIGISTSLPKLNVSNTKPYQEYYNVETKELVRRTFEPDIRLFEYDFE